MLDVRKAVKHLMLDKELKAKQLSDSIGMNTRAFSNWLYKSDTPRLDTIENILSGLGCHLAIVDDETGEILFQ